jgi:hypothetical protein
LTVHVAPAAMLPAVNDTTAAPAAGANVGVPQPLVLTPGVGATTIAPGAVGKLSLKARPVNAVAMLGLVMVKRSTPGTPAAIGLVMKVLLMLAGAVATTVRMSLSATPVPPLAVVTVPVVLV